MAQYDGAITISTKLDNSQFERSAIRLELAVMKLADTINTFATQIAEGINVSLQKNGADVEQVTNNYNTYNETIKEATQRANEARKAFSSSHNAMNKSLSKILGQFTKITRMLRTRVIRKIVSTIYNTLSQAFSALKIADPSFGDAWDKLSKSFSEIIAQLSTLMLPVLNAIVPVLQTILNYFGGIVEKVTQFVAGLSGSTTYLKAIKKSVNETKRALAGFDTLNILSDNSSSGLIDYKKAEIPEDVKRFTDTIKSLMDKNSWEEIGTLIGDAVFSWFDLSNFDNLGKDVVQIIKNVIDFVIGFINRPDTFSGIANALFDAVSGIIEVLFNSDGDESIVDKLFRLIGVLIGDVASFLATLISRVIDWLGDLMTSGTTIGKIASFLVKMLVNPLVQVSKGLMQAIKKSTVLSWLFEKIAGQEINWDNEIKDMENWFDNAYKSIENGVNNIVSGNTTMGAHSGGGFSFAPVSSNTPTADEYRAQFEANMSKYEEEARQQLEAMNATLNSINGKSNDVYLDGTRINLLMSEEEARAKMIMGYKRSATPTGVG